MSNSERRIVDFDKLNLVGKALFLTGSAVKALASGLDAALNQAADLVVDIERSFKDGLDPNIEEAKIIEEREEPSRKTSKSADRQSTSG